MCITQCYSGFSGGSEIPDKQWNCTELQNRKRICKVGETQKASNEVVKYISGFEHCNPHYGLSSTSLHDP